MVKFPKTSCQKEFLFATAFVLFSTFCLAQKVESVAGNKTDLFSTEHESYQVLTQYYRWFLTFEREQTKARIDNHMSLLTDSVLVVTRNGPLKGKAGVLGFMNYVSSWKNAHHIQSTNVRDNADGTLSLEADIVYQNILPDGSKNAYNLHYSTQLKRRQGELPQFTNLTLTPVSVINTPLFEDAYTENRCRALVYYWMYLADTMNDNSKTIGEIIDPNIQVTTGNKKIIGRDAYISWLGKSQHKYPAQLRSFKNLKTETGPDGSITLSMEVEWKGVDRKGVSYVSESRHHWILSEKADDAFAKIREMKITDLTPIKKLSGTLGG